MFSKMTDISLGNLKNSLYMTSVHRKVTREDIIRWMKYPEKYAKDLRDASIYLYEISTQYRRVVNYFADICPLYYIVYPFKFDPENCDRKKFAASYKKALNYLENLYNGLLATQNVNGALQTDQALKICKISYELDNRIRGGQDFDKILTAYDKLVKTAEFTPKNAKNVNDFDSIGELIAWMEKRGWKNPYYDDVPKDIVDETMQNIQAFNQRLYVNESGIGEEINRRLEALNNARVNESDEFVEKETFDLDQYESDGYDGLFDAEEFQADLDEANQQDKSQWDNDDRLNQKI